MLRRFLIALSHSSAAQRFVTGFPLARRVARRFVAGETQAEALAAIRQLNQAGMLATIDYLGEHVTETEAASANVREYESVLAAIAAAGLQSGVSLKLSAMGLHIDPEFCFANVRQIVTAAQRAQRFVRIDIEESSLVDVTLDIYRRLRIEFDNVGVVLQSYLFRTEADVQALIEAGIADLRLVKGAYDEPESIAWQDRETIRQQLIGLSQMLLAPEARARGARLAVGSHDDLVYNAVAAHAAAQGIDPAAWEIQFLYGIRRDEQARLAAAGHRMRIYVPYGRAWYPYFMRRLAERPANLIFFLRALAGK
ncbi:MAG: proline dehydrogenase family protein [Caldilineales bacterium]|nr:proline dehydrogenase family protein [Caldilineales bacterium]